MDERQTTLCTHTEMRENQHKFVFHSSNRDALKAWANHIEQLQLQRKWYNRAQVSLLLDVRSSSGLSVRVFFEYLSDYNRPYAQLKPPKVRIAFVHGTDFEVKDVYQQFADLMTTPTEIGFFLTETDAIAALQAE